jgi:hypothetical protein
MITTLELQGWAEQTGFTVVSMSPIYLIPIGGVYRASFKVF